MPLVEQAPVKHLGQFPPDRFNVIVGVGNISIFLVHPETHPFNHTLPISLVSPYGFLASFDKAFYTISLDLWLTVYAYFFLYLKLHWKPMRIPSSLANNIIPFHRLVTREEILVHTWH